MSRDASGELIQSAIAALEFAYCPYSSFPVGCAVRDERGRIHIGVNVENAAYPVGSCAEAAAIAALVASGARKVAAVAVASNSRTLSTPCGACRQRIREFAGPEVPIHVCGAEGLRRSFTLAELLPASFGPENLARDGA